MIPPSQTTFNSCLLANKSSFSPLDPWLNHCKCTDTCVIYLQDGVGKAAFFGPIMQSPFIMKIAKIWDSRYISYLKMLVVLSHLFWFSHVIRQPIEIWQQKIKCYQKWAHLLLIQFKPKHVKPWHGFRSWRGIHHFFVKSGHSKIVIGACISHLSKQL